MNNLNRPTNSTIWEALIAVKMNLQNIWKSKRLALKTRIKLYKDYNDNVKSSLLD